MCPLEANLIVRHALIVTQDSARQAIADGAIAVAGGRIVAVGSTADVEAEWVAPEAIDATGKALLPGMFNIHTHLFQSAVKGMGEDLPVEEWVRAVTFPTAQALTPDDAYLLAMVSCLENLRSGATTVMDFMYPLKEPALHEAVIQAMLDSGLRSIYTRTVNDAGADVGVLPALIEPAEQTLAHAIALQKQFDGAGDGRMRIGIAVGSIWGMTEPGLRATRRVADETGMLVTMHVNESPFDDVHTRARLGLGTIPLLQRTGLLGPDFVAVHCVHMSDEDIALFVQNEVSVAYNAVSNMYLGSGIAPIVRFQREGLTLGISSDGSGSNNCQDMIQTLKISALLQKVAAQDASVVLAQDAFDWATRGGARALRMLDQAGSLEVGKVADFFLLDAWTPTAVPVHDPVATLVYSASHANVRDVVVAGRVLLRDGAFVQVDEASLLLRTQAAAQALAQRSGTERNLEGRARWWPA
jgi:5-methylthioadenosine/S-adenosylhomocysteine deaminase